MAKVQPIPQGYHAVTPYLYVRNGNAALDYYKRALGATELMRMPDPQGKIMHAELQIGDSRIMLSDETPERGQRSPQTLGGSPMGIHLYVDNVDALVKRAVDAGGKLLSPVQDHFYGDRSGQIEDPFGHTWFISTHTEDVSPEEMEQRMAKAFSAQPTR
jgi:PhnB protein